MCLIDDVGGVAICAGLLVVGLWGLVRVRLLRVLWVASTGMSQDLRLEWVEPLRSGLLTQGGVRSTASPSAQPVPSDA